MISTVVPPTLEAPKITPKASSHKGSVKVRIRVTPASGTTIRYTTDGSEPTPESPIYNGPVNLTQDTVIKAKAWNNGYQESASSQISYSVSQ